MTAWFVVGAVTLLALINSGPAVGEWYISDAGLVQQSTLTLLLVAAVTAGVRAVLNGDNRVNLLLFMCGLFIYAGREHDLHRLEFLPEHYTRLQFYTLAEVTLWQKIGFGLLMIFIASVIGVFAVRMFVPALRGLKNSEPWAVLGIVWLATLIASQVADRSWLNDTYGGRAFEEVAELVAGGLALLVVCYFPRQADGSALAPEVVVPSAPAKSAQLANRGG